MSENRDRSMEEFSKFDAMSTEELEELLRLDAEALEGTESDVEVLFYIMGVLADRRRNSGNAGKTAQEAYESFKQHYLPKDPAPAEPEKKTGHGVLLRRLTAAAAAVAVVILCSATASALGHDVWGAVVKWTQETFYFSTGEQSQVSAPTPKDELGYASLQEALECNNIDPNIVPAGMLEGYQLGDIIIEQTPLQTLCMACYSNGEKTIKITVRKGSEEDPTQFERSDTYTDTYGTVYCISEDNGQLRAAWKAGEYECYITGDILKEEIKMLIDTIPKG